MNSILATELKKSTKRLANVRKKEQDTWDEHKKLLKLAVEQGMSLQEVATLVNVTKARVWQIVKE